ncbi:MAG: glycosyltransferase family 2 protein, partial [Vicinamibacterales bacterium]
FGVSKPLWPGDPPDWFSPRHSALFAALDYGPKSFVVTSLATPFYGLNFGVRRQAVLDLGGFNEHLGVVEDMGGLEDIDLFRRALAAKMRVAYMPGAVIHHVIPEHRMERAFHRERLKAGMRMYYRTIEDQYRAQPSVLGVPRFLFGKAINDTMGYARSVLRRDRAETFHYELQLVKFSGVYRQAAAMRRARASQLAPSANGDRS